jgi:hypothetical protein
MEHFNNWESSDPYIDPCLLQSTECFLWNDFSITPPDNSTSSSTPSSSDSLSDNALPKGQIQNPKKRRQTSESPLSDALIRERKKRTVKNPPETARIRAKGACLECKRKKKPVSHIFKFATFQYVLRHST